MDWETLIAKHLTRYPAAEPADVYKLLYQGVRGPEHLMASPEVFVVRLQAEYEAVSSGDDVPLWEPVRPDGTLGRLHLRPYRARGGELAPLVAACLEAAAQPWGSALTLAEVWQAAAANREVAWQTLTAQLVAQGYPPVHHSERYRAAYRPAYRLVQRDFVETTG